MNKDTIRQSWLNHLATMDTFEKQMQRQRYESMPWGALFYDPEVDAYFDGNGDEL